MGVSSGTLVVTQTPAVSAMEGETVNVSCCWTWTGKPERMTVDWLKNQTSVKIDIFSLTNHSQGSLRMDTSDCLNLTFMKISREDSGRYTCKASVEIPLLVEFEGNGTVITVTARENTKDHTNPPTADNSDSNTNLEDILIHALRCLPILALVTSFICLKKLRTRAQQHTPAALGNKPPSAQRTEEDQEEEDRDEREIVEV
ncbi:uncharacterized protein LOC127349519 isoform X2 [Dicentrarchus labrax]|uniref:uncharacterized protein LOC127349519 isoform X2 n=1 Tax=Dicentrarchus labrax TaxID=13489 RepID=UPI0021F52E58|nr:uncharacterized protein LOC127349519 isoform X2 [Dicentrarchus labrax]